MSTAKSYKDFILKPMYLIEDLDNKKKLKEIIATTAESLKK